MEEIPNYDFKCNKCGKVEEGKFSFKEAKKGFSCGSCNGKMEMQFPLSIAITGCNRFMRKRGIDAKQDRYYANKSLEEKGKLPRGIKPEKGVV